jgi:hypothetical protein
VAGVFAYKLLRPGELLAGVEVCRATLHLRVQTGACTARTGLQSAQLKRSSRSSVPYRSTSISKGMPPNWLLAVTLFPLMVPVERRGDAFWEWKSMALLDTE